MEIRQSCITYLKTLKEVNQIEIGDESDLIEADKTAAAKLESRQMAFAQAEAMQQ